MMTTPELVRVNAESAPVQEGSEAASERKRLATGLRTLASKTFEDGARRKTLCEVKRAVAEAAIIRKVANLIESGNL